MVKFMQEKGIFDYCKNVCKGKCCLTIGCQQLDKCNNELCISFTCKKVRKECNLSAEDTKEAIRIKREVLTRYRKLYGVRNPYKELLK